MDIVGKWLQVMAEECEIILGADMRHGVTNWKPRFHDLMGVKHINLKGEHLLGTDSNMDILAFIIRSAGQLTTADLEDTGISSKSFQHLIKQIEQIHEQLSLENLSFKSNAGMLTDEEAGRSMGKFLHKCPKLMAKFTEAWPISFQQTGLTGTALNEIAEALPEQIALLKQWPEGIANAGNTELLSTEDPADARAGGLGRCGVAPPAGWPEPRLRAPGRLRALLSAGGGWPPRAPRIEAPSSFLVSSLEVPGMSLGGS